MTDLTTTLLLVRHGQVRAEDGSYGPDTPFSELGVRQSEALADALAGDAAPTHVYASPLFLALRRSQGRCARGLDCLLGLTSPWRSFLMPV
jgi:broad specificity phosphatase PhoE